MLAAGHKEQRSPPLFSFVNWSRMALLPGVSESALCVHLPSLLSPPPRPTPLGTLKKGFEFSGERKIKKDKFAAVVDEYGSPVDGKVSEADIEKWGVGLSPEDYENLNNHYKYLTTANPNIDNNQKIFILDLCYTKMQQQRCVRERDMDNYKKMGDYYNSTFAKSGLRAANDSGKDDDNCLGMWAARISQYTPEEYYKNKTLYKDYDNLGDYFERFVLRPLRNLMHGTTDRDYEFYVKDESEEDTYADFDGE